MNSIKTTKTRQDAEDDADLIMMVGCRIRQQQRHKPLGSPPLPLQRTTAAASLLGWCWWCLLVVFMVINDGVSATDAAAATPSSGKAPDSYGNAVAAAVESPSSLPQQQRYDGNEQQRILSRKRRYLIFPQGSSLQLVYDMYYPIVDNANLIYIGITNALAYQLPYEPIEWENLLNMQTPDNGNDGNNNGGDDGQASMPVATAALAPNAIPIGNSAARRPIPPNADRYYTRPAAAFNRDSYYAQQSPGNRGAAGTINAAGAPVRTTGGTYYIGTLQAPPDRRPGLVDKFTNKLDHYFSYANRAMQTLSTLDRERFDPWKQVKWTPTPATNGRYSPPSPPSGIQHRFGDVSAKPHRQHAIHPIFGRKKRSNATTPTLPPPVDKTDDTTAANATRPTRLTDVDRIHLNLHRSTRHSLYTRIARLIDMKNMTGTACVRRALCETSQQPDAGEPGTFLVELMRAIFSLPLLGDFANGSDSGGGRVNAAHRQYDEAIAVGRQRLDCQKHFGQCAGSVWAGAFSM